jgi:hypothetical protein
MAATDARNSRRAVGSGVLCAARSEAIERGPAAIYIYIYCHMYGVRVTKIKGSSGVIGFIGTSVAVSLNYNYYSAVSDLHNLQFTVAHALGFSVSTSRLLATDLNTENITSNDSVVLCPNLDSILTIH